MALYHFHVSRVSRGAGQSAVASAAYRAGEELEDEYYGEIADYTNKGGVIESEILTPEYVPDRLKDRKTLWNEVEKIEKHPQAQLAYSFDIALQNELSMEENIALAREFVMKEFVAKGMIVDLAIHAPEKDGGIQNPHFHVLCPIRPITTDGEWGSKQRREYVLYDNGEVQQKPDGTKVFNAVPTTDWGRPETLEDWRKAWAKMVNNYFKVREIEASIDNRSYANQGIEKLAQVHEGPAVRQMEQRGIATRKGSLNRWINEINRMHRELGIKISELVEWIRELKIEMNALKEEYKKPSLGDIVIQYYDARNKVADTYERGRQKAKITNMKGMLEMTNFLSGNKIFTVDDLEMVIDTSNKKLYSITDSMKQKEKRIKELDSFAKYASWYEEGLPIQQLVSKQKFTKKKDDLESQYHAELTKFRTSKRILKENGISDLTPRKWIHEKAEIQASYDMEYAKLKDIRSMVKELNKVKKIVNDVMSKNEPNKKREVER